LPEIEVKERVPDRESNSPVAGRLDLSEGALRVAVHRLRSRYRELLWNEIRQTVDTEEEVAGEIRDLFSALAR
jgi:hypothetical protein